MKQFKVDIFNHSFMLKTAKDEKYVRGIEAYVNGVISKMCKNQKILRNDEQIELALKTCLAIADEYMSLKEEIELYKKELGGIVKQISL